MKVWADKGVDGFRMDAFQYASKDTTFPEWPEGHEKNFNKWYGMRPQLHDYLKEMNREVLSKYDVFAVAEGAGTTFKDAHDLVDEDRNELQMAYHFESVGLANNLDGYKLSDFKDAFTRWDESFKEKGWIAIYLSNHDNARLATRFGNDSEEFRTVSTQMLNTFLLSMKGTPYTYFGDEIGMTNVDMPTIEEYVDIQALGHYKTALKANEDMDEFMKYMNLTSRENSRTPMQWNDSKNAGFTTGIPWKRVNPNYPEINVSKQDKNPNSVLNHFRKMVELRKAKKILVYGAYKLLDKENEEIYAFTRSLNGKKVLVLLNFTDHDSSFNSNLLEAQLGNMLINNYDDLNLSDNQNITLKPYQAVICELNTTKQ